MAFIGSVSQTLNVTVKEVAVETALTIAVSPATTVSPGAPLDFTGRLSRADTGAGVVGQKIRLRQPPGGNVVGEGTTDSEGNYMIQISAPMKSRTYPYRAVFEGTADLSQAESRTLGVGVGVGVPIEPIWIIGSFLSAVFLLGVSLFKSSR
ncbi:hypothetical protein LCGC14_1151300 [marine sediment metagenome]|uniref:Carboxypeptidase regulatory-like domain-containing protein n=1 Tax=marine sediment metagenome TaxID=412755 RepID=A0A0F9LVD4_9ZZZZ